MSLDIDRKYKKRGVGVCIVFELSLDRKYMKVMSDYFDNDFSRVTQDFKHYPQWLSTRF